MPKGKEQNKTLDFNNELLDYIINSTFFNNGESLDELSYFDLLKGAKTRNNARNILINEIQKKGIDFLAPAIRAFNTDFDTGDGFVPYTSNSFDIKKAKMVPLEIDKMPIELVDNMTAKLASLLGYNDNNEEKGALKKFLADYYGEDFFDIIAGGHATEGSFSEQSKKIANKIKELVTNNDGAINIDLLDNLYKELGYLPGANLEEILDVDKGLPHYAQRSFRANSRDASLPAKILSTAESFVAPQVAQAYNEGRTPNLVDVGTDVAEMGILLGTRGLSKRPVIGAGIETGLDMAHDGAMSLLYGNGTCIVDENGNPVLECPTDVIDEVFNTDRLADFGKGVSLGLTGKGLGALGRLTKSSGKKYARDYAKQFPEGQLRDEAYEMANSPFGKKLVDLEDRAGKLTQMRDELLEKGTPEAKTQAEFLDKMLQGVYSEMDKWSAKQNAVKRVIQLGKDRWMYNPNVDTGALNLLLNGFKN